MSGFLSADELIFRQQAQQLSVRLDNIEITNRLETYINKVNKSKNEKGNDVDGNKLSVTNNFIWITFIFM